MKIQCPHCQQEFDYMGVSHTINLTERKIKELNQNAIEKSLKRYKPQTQMDKRRKLKGILQYLYAEHEVKYLLDYGVDEIEDWLEYTEHRLYEKNKAEIVLSYKAKTKLRTHLLKLVLYMIKHELQNPNAFTLLAFWQYLLSNDFYHFSQSGIHRRIPLVNPEEIKELLANLQNRQFRDYIVLAILMYSGCRVGGLVNLQVKHLNFDNATFESQEKATSLDSGWNTYFLPVWFMDHIKTYLLRSNLTQNDFLCGVSEKTVRDILHIYKPEWWPHLMRHTLRVQWELKGMSSVHAKFLQNHEPESVDETYLQGLYDIPHLRVQYDRYFPY